MSKKADIFERIAASAPLDATAAKVTGRGTHFEQQLTMPERKYSEIPIHSDLPSLLKPIPNVYNFVDITGRKSGKLTVIGFLGYLNPKNQKKSSWLVRCVCGRYETRHAKAFKSADPYLQTMQCLACQKWEVTKNRFDKQGSRPIASFTQDDETLVS